MEENKPKTNLKKEMSELTKKGIGGSITLRRACAILETRHETLKKIAAQLDISPERMNPKSMYNLSVKDLAKIKRELDRRRTKT